MNKNSWSQIEGDDVVIVGAGIGGLAAALSLHQLGINVRVFESVAELKPLGVGINLLPHAVRELEALDLLEDVTDSGITPTDLIYCTKRGERIWSEPRGVAAGYRWPQVSIHRGVLQSVLLTAVRKRIGADRVLTGHHFVSMAFDADVPERGVTCRFARAGQEPLDVKAKLLIGADGIHSVVRRYFYPNEGAPKWNGALLWRGLAESKAILDGRTMVWAGHPKQKFVCYPIRDLTSDGRTQLINFIAELRFDQHLTIDREDWNRPGKLEDVLPSFENWNFAWLDCPGLLRASTGTYVFPMVDRDPLPRWTFGPVTLLGDAAHPMYPIGSNGASQAILDSRVLAGCLRSYESPFDALRRYDTVRREATARIVLANRQLGPEEPMAVVEDRAPNGFNRLSDVITDTELAHISDRYKQLAGFAVTELNERPSLAEMSW